MTRASHSSVDIANGARESGSSHGAGGPPGSIPSAFSTSAATPRIANGSDPRATRSSSAAGSPSTLPSSRIDPRERKVGNAATSAECSRP